MKNLGTISHPATDKAFWSHDLAMIHRPDLDPSESHSKSSVLYCHFQEYSKKAVIGFNGLSEAR